MTGEYGSGIASTVGTIALLSSFGVYLSPLRNVLRMRSRSDVAGESVVPYAVMATNCLIWLVYGMGRKDSILIVSNLVGSLFGGYYSFVFYTASKNKPKIALIFSGFAVFIVVAFWYTLQLDTDVDSVSALGIIGDFTTVALFGSPLVQLVEVLKRKSVESMPFALCLANFACTFIWTVYGFLLWDFYITAPNILGLILNTLQVSLFVIFPSQSHRTVDVGNFRAKNDWLFNKAKQDDLSRSGISSTVKRM